MGIQYKNMYTIAPYFLQGEELNWEDMHKENINVYTYHYDMQMPTRMNHERAKK